MCTDGKLVASDAALSRRKVIGRKDAVFVGLASAAAGASGLLILFISSKLLTKADNAEFIAFWSLLFGIFGILTGIQTEATRASHMSLNPGSGASSSKFHPPIILVAAALGIVLAVAIEVSSFVWAPTVLGDDWRKLSTLVAVGSVLFSIGTGINGVLGGTEQWRPYSRMITAEACLRLMLVVVAAAVGATVLGLAFGAAIGTAAWVVVGAISRRTRRAFFIRSDSGFKDLLRQTGHACLATGSSAILVVGFPVLLRLTSPDSIYLGSAPLLMAITLTRAPLMIPLGTYQSVAVTHFLRRQQDGIRAIYPIARVILLLGGGGGALAWAIGPWLMVLIFGTGYHVAGWVLGLLTFAASLLALVTITGSLCLAFKLHRSFSMGWVLATALSVVVLLLPVPLEMRVILSLISGPLLGIAIHVRALLIKN